MPWEAEGSSPGLASPGGEQTGGPCAKLTGDVQEVQVLYGKGNNQIMSFPEPCGRSREGPGEASAGVQCGRGY